MPASPEENSTAPDHSANDSGMAMVMVLGVLSVALLLVVHAMSICEVIATDSAVSARKTELRYLAESASDRTFWMHLTDRRLFRNRSLGQDDEGRIGTALQENWLADRRRHIPFPETRCHTYIGAVEKSIRLDKPESFKENIPLEETERREQITAFLDVLGDYTDQDSARKLNGKDTDDYASEGFLAMPRNNAMQYKEELYWLDGWQDAVTAEVTIIPPKGKSLGTNSKPSFFSAEENTIRAALEDATDAEIASVLASRRSWILDGTPLEDTLDTTLLLKIRGKFSFQESDVAQYTAVASSPDGSIRVTRNTVRECNLSRATIYADRSSQTFSLWHQTTY